MTRFSESYIRVNLRGMDKGYFEDQVFEKTDFTKTSFASRTYDGCTFIQCEFPEADLKDARFADCRFERCNLSLAKLSGTSFQKVEFIQCKLMGLQFDNCSPFLFEVNFRECTLSHSSFYKRKMKNTVFEKTILQEVDFTEADLTGASFESTDLTGAIFENTILNKADLRTATNYHLHPAKNSLQKARFSYPGVLGLLTAFKIEVSGFLE